MRACSTRGNGKEQEPTHIACECFRELPIPADLIHRDYEMVKITN